MKFFNGTYPFRDFFNSFLTVHICFENFLNVGISFPEKLRSIDLAKPKSGVLGEVVQSLIKLIYHE